MIRALLTLLLALVLVGPLAGCGKKGDPTLPTGVSDDHPRKYPTAE